MVDCAGLENQNTSNRIEGSNPSVCVNVLKHIENIIRR